MTFSTTRVVVLSIMLWNCAVQASDGGQYVAVDLFTLERARLDDILSGYGGNAVNGGQIVGSIGGGVNAGLWSGPAGNLTSLHPTAFEYLTYSKALGTDGSHQVGYVRAPNQRAVLWGGTAATAIDLHPEQLGYFASFATGVAGRQQVGAGYAPDGSLHAILWNGSSDSAVDLQPTNLQGVEWTSATATDGAEQVGYMNRWISNSTLQGHAALWRGSADSSVDLHPVSWENLGSTSATGVGGGQQVGYGIFPGFGGGEFHAILWSGTAESAVDLHPAQVADLYHSTATGTDGMHQVGFISTTTNFRDRAVLWSGSALSMVDLHDLLPLEMIESFAYSIHDGNVYGIATDSTGSVHAVMWVPVAVPEPPSLVMVASALIASSAVIRRRSTRYILAEIMS